MATILKAPWGKKTVFTAPDGEDRGSFVFGGERVKFKVRNGEFELSPEVTHRMPRRVYPAAPYEVIVEWAGGLRQDMLVSESSHDI